MKRSLYMKLLEWKNSSNRKPLLLQGARQVGKTYLVKEFGKNRYTNFVNLNFEEKPDLKALFSGNLDPENIINNISLYIGEKIVAKDTLLFFDEIQAAPEALTSLKYFQEESPEFHIIAAGSLLGISVGKQASFPVGKVNFMTMHPLTFTEYLIAFGEELVADKLNNIKKAEAFPEPIHKKLLRHLKSYLFLGGMPEVLQSYLDKADISLARHIQNEILEAYKRDFSKHTTKPQAIKTSELWYSIPYQIAKENKKFKYSDVSKKGRASTFEGTIEWLNKAGLINITNNISVPKIPLAGYTDNSKFKIYLHDTGLLGAMLNLSSEIIIKPIRLFSEYNGAFIESFVASELVASGNNELYYWTSKSAAEVDFIIQTGNNVYPLEVKSGTNLRISSLRSYAEKYQPALIFRTSPRNFIRSDEFINIPLYAISSLNKLIAEYKGN